MRGNLSGQPIAVIESILAEVMFALTVLGGHFNRRSILHIKIGRLVQGPPQAKEFIKATINRPSGHGLFRRTVLALEIIKPQVPFAGHARVIAVSLEQLGQGDLFGFDETVIVPERVASR